MLFVILAMALFVAVGGVLAFLTVQGRMKDKLDTTFDVKQSEPFALLSISQAFDPDYAIIWDTQVPALQLVDKAGAEGLPVNRLQLFYNRSARTYPELYDGSTFGNWLEFLRKQQLIAGSGKRVFITAEGHEFLAYRLIPEGVLAA